MKEQTFPGFLYHTDKVVVNPELMPVNHPSLLPDYGIYSSVKEAQEYQDSLYQQALAKWESNNIEVENFEDSGPPIADNCVWAKFSNCSSLMKFYEGQPCTCKMSGERAKILTLK